MLENLSDKELFQLRDDLETEIAYLSRDSGRYDIIAGSSNHWVWSRFKKMSKLEEVDNEITRRDEK